MKNILINGLLLHGTYSGVQYYIEYLIETLSKMDLHDSTLEVLVSQNYNGILRESKYLKINKISLNTSNRLSRIYFENFLLAGYFKRRRFDLFHSPGSILPLFFRMPGMVTIHDLVPLRYPSLCQNETVLYYKLFLPPTIRKASTIITVSDVVRKDIIDRFPDINKEKIVVIYPGLHSRFKKITEAEALEKVKHKYHLPDKFFLFVGNLEPRKNIIGIIQAFAALKKEHCKEFKLVLAGRKAWKYTPIFELTANLGLQHEVLFPGFVDVEDMPVLYSLAKIFLFPSIYEGFGLPVLEAMACECPAIVSDRGALPEISGGICPQVDPFHPSELMLAILAVLRNKEYRASQISRGLRWSHQFTWETAAEKMANIYHSFMG
ncbi:glycosyltransferase family 4 protein [Puia dinghuensis]|uniref:glycosyltransferase family 4 protein n=1 Tax=Puia dinghuensis TaxID=1792502 RepID=UPI00166B640A|nr:glycosyltransferase family 1 protein [Puia dinghuensis]